MPSKGNPFVRGNLYIAFHVKFPESLPPHVIQQLKQLLPEPTPREDEQYDREVVEEHHMEAADLRHFGKGGAAVGSDSYDSDGEDGQNGARAVQCNQS